LESRSNIIEELNSKTQSCHFWESCSVDWEN